jgi:uncharacterized membrane protein YozB (DUF420 family)
MAPFLPRGTEMTDLLHSPGFLGTRANFAADATLIAMIIIGVLLTIGFVLARQKHYQAHRWIQSTSAVANLIFVLWLMILPFRDFVLRDVGGPRPAYFYIITALHAFFGILAVLLGVFVVLRANGLMIKPLRFNNYKAFMLTSYSLYMITIILGVVVYFVWFVAVPNSPVYE